MKPIIEIYKSTDLSIDTSYSGDANQYLFRHVDGQCFTGTLHSTSEDATNKDLHIRQYGYRGARFEVTDVTHFIAINELIHS